MILYIHGFNSSSLSGKAQETKRWLEARGRGHEWVCPDLPHRPVKAIRLLVDILDAMARGDAVSLIPIHKELTTQEAANLLNVSRPYLVKLIENGEIPFHKNGVRRKVLFKDLMEYKHKRDQASMALLDELTAEAQDFDMGY